MLRALRADLGPRFAPERVSLDNYVVEHRGQSQALDRIRALASRLSESVQAGQCIVLFGTVGTGKDHLLASLLHIVTAQRISAIYLTGPTFSAKLREQISGFKHLHLSLENLCAIDVLALSDPAPPAEDLAAWEANKLHWIVDERYRAMLPTWLTMNARDEQEIKERLTVQTWDRLRENAVVIPTFWPSYRGRGKSS
jgi:DNA replication protein DnaC